MFGNPGFQANYYRRQVRTPTRKLCLGNKYIEERKTQKPLTLEGVPCAPLLFCEKHKTQKPLTLEGVLDWHAGPSIGPWQVIQDIAMGFARAHLYLISN